MRTYESLPFEVQAALREAGSNVRLARTRRRMSQDDLAAKCNITRKTLYGIETGAPGASFAAVLTVLWALGLLADVKAVANPESDEHGKVLERARQPSRVRQSNALDNDF